MTEIEHLREQSRRAERLSRGVLDTLTVQRLLDAAQIYKQQADQLDNKGVSHPDQRATRPHSDRHRRRNGVYRSLNVDERVAFAHGALTRHPCGKGEYGFPGKTSVRRQLAPNRSHGSVATDKFNETRAFVQFCTAPAQVLARQNGRSLPRVWADT